MGIYTVNAQLSQHLHWLLRKMIASFFPVLYLNIAKFYVYIMQTFHLQTFL